MICWWGKKLDEEQYSQLRSWLAAVADVRWVLLELVRTARVDRVGYQDEASDESRYNDEEAQPSGRGTMGHRSGKLTDGGDGAGVRTKAKRGRGGKMPEQSEIRSSKRCVLQFVSVM